MKTRLTALILILALLLSCCTAFAESNALDSDSFLGKSTSFTYTISVNINTNFVNQYDEVAPLQYAMAKDWDPSGNGNTRKVDIKVIMPPSGSESDYLNTIISTGDYSDIMVLENANTNASEMYENGQSLDITDYVLQYMPNYLAYFDRHPELKGRETCLVNGEPRYLCLYPRRPKFPFRRKAEDRLPGSAPPGRRNCLIPQKKALDSFYCSFFMSP